MRTQPRKITYINRAPTADRGAEGRKHLAAQLIELTEMLQYLAQSVNGAEIEQLSRDVEMIGLTLEESDLCVKCEECNELHYVHDMHDRDYCRECQESRRDWSDTYADVDAWYRATR